MSMLDFSCTILITWEVLLPVFIQGLANGGPVPGSHRLGLRTWFDEFDFLETVHVRGECVCQWGYLEGKG